MKLTKILLSETIMDNGEEVISKTATSISKTTEQINSWISSILDAVPGVLGRIIVALIFFFIGHKAIKIFLKHLKKSFEKSAMDESVSKFLLSLLKVVFNVVLILATANILNIATSSAIAILGSAGLTVGLALQGSLANFAGGVLILLMKPFSVGDYIIADGKEGTVCAIDIFYTRMLTIENCMVVIPNGMLSNMSIVNVTKETERTLDLEIPVAYSSNLEQVKNVLLQVAKEEELLKNAENVKIFVKKLDNSAIMVGFRGITLTENYWNCRWSLLEKIKKAFDENGIEIPFQQMDINISKKDAK
ncbi:MAG: mechanosensitive ion channel family protein [Lachnospiraceae bacterium]|nr:mechanosensitive ion channel family protein [Lachnospiraceae bacterium]